MANLFKGYVESVGKKPIHALKDGEFLKTPPTSGDYVGILRDDIIQVDFDDEYSASIALKIVNDYKFKCDILKTTRGVHLYFIDDGYVNSQSVGLYNAIGLTSDIGLGKKIRAVPLRITKDEEDVRVIDGEQTKITTQVTTERPWIQTYSDLDPLPSCFRPIGKHNYNLQKCDTRNNTLFTYILTLQSHNFSKTEIRYTLKIINKYIFENPLSDKELDVITREDAFSDELFFNEKGGFLHDRFGNYMLTNCNIILLNNQVHIYTKDGLYSSLKSEFEKVMLSKIPYLKDSQRVEVYKYICLKCTKRAEFSSPKYIGLADSIMDIETGQEFPYSPSFIIGNKINVRYNESAYSEVMDKTLNKVSCNDKEIRMLLEEMIGYTLYRKNSMQVCFILTGEGSNGKSTILNCIKKLLGRENYTSLDLRELEDTFKPAELYNKLANIGDDISSKFLEGSSVFKKCVTGESFMVARKYCDPFQLESYATQIFCANEMPQVKDKSDGFTRRLMIIPFNAKFSYQDADYDPFVEDKLNTDESIEYLLKLALEGLKRVINRNKFTKSEIGEHEKEEYVMSNNNVIEWLSENPKIERESISDVYLAYKVWCTRDGCSPVKKLNFAKEIRKKCGLVSIPRYVDGKTIRVFVKESEIDAL